VKIPFEVENVDFYEIIPSSVENVDRHMKMPLSAENVDWVTVPLLAEHVDFR